jgi:hypothetical protein
MPEHRNKRAGFWFFAGVVAGAVPTLLCWCWERKEHCPPPGQIPDRLDDGRLRDEISVRISGSPADGRATQSVTAQQVIWVDAGDEVLVHLDSTKVKSINGTILVSVDLETDQTGRSPVVLAFSLAAGGGPGSLIATTDELPHGEPRLVARWGRVLQDAVWAALIDLARQHAGERGGWPAGLTAEPGALRLTAGPPIQIAAGN